MIRAHRDAVIASLNSDLPGAVFHSYAAANNTRYAVVFIARAEKERSRYSSAQIRDRFTITVHSVGTDEDSCLWVQERVDRLTGKTLTVANRFLRPVEFITGTAPDLNDQGTTPLWWAISQFDIISDPV